MLMGAGAGAVGLAAMEIGLPAATASASEDNSGNNSGSALTGAWLIVHTDTSPDTSSAQSVVTFDDGGALVARDINPPGDAQLGAWRATGDRGFVGTFYDSFSEGPNGPVHIVKVIVKGAVDDDNDKVSGTFTFTITPPPPNFPSSGGTGTFEGTRLVPGS
jgi:hypothetical protein